MGVSGNLETFYYGVLYFFCSASMLLCNKLAINSYPAPGLIILYQYMFSVGAVSIIRFCRLAEVDALRWNIIKKYYPVPALFACAVFANNKILENANIETFIVVRNTTPILVAIFEFCVMGKNLPTLRSVFCFMLIITGAVMYGLTDQGFKLESYMWALIYLTVFCTEMVFVKHIFNSVNMTTFGRMLYTNTLSIPFQPFFIFSTGEYLKYNDLVLTANGLIFIIMSCLGGFGISFAGIGFRSRVSATTFTLIGVVNKIITITVNYVMWDQHASHIGLISLGLCLVGSTLYRPASLRDGTHRLSENLFLFLNNCSNGCCEAMQLARDRGMNEASFAKEQAKDEEEGIGFIRRTVRDNEFLSKSASKK